MENVLEHLASALGRRDEQPNITFAERIVTQNDTKAIQTLVTNLQHKNKDIRSDCIKVLYEAGARQPKLIAPYHQEFLALMNHKDNRLQWGAMIALDYLTPLKPKELFQALPAILDAARQGSVITRDHVVNILIQLAAQPDYREGLTPLIFEQLLLAPANQFPMYLEKSAPLVDAKTAADLIRLINSRLNDLEKDSQKKRVDKVIKYINKRIQ